MHQSDSLFLERLEGHSVDGFAHTEVFLCPCGLIIHVLHDQKVEFVVVEVLPEADVVDSVRIYPLKLLCNVDPDLFLY